MATFAVMGFLNGPYSLKMDDECEACFVICMVICLLAYLIYLYELFFKQ